MTQSYYGSYSAFTNFLITIFSAHTNVNSFDIGEVDDYSVTGEDDYPRVFLELPIISEFDSNSLVWNCAFTVTKQTLLERDDEQAKINECWDIATDIMEALKDPVSVGYTAFSYNYLVNDNFNFTTLTRFKDDFTAGVRVELSIRQKNPVNLCDLKDSFNFLIPPPPSVCDFILPLTQFESVFAASYCVSDVGPIETDPMYIDTNEGFECPLLFRFYFNFETVKGTKTEIYYYLDGVQNFIDINAPYFEVTMYGNQQFSIGMSTESGLNIISRFYNVYVPELDISLPINTRLKLNDQSC